MVAVENVGLDTRAEFSFISSGYVPCIRLLEGGGIIDFLLEFNVVRRDDQVLNNHRSQTFKDRVRWQFRLINRTSLGTVNRDLVVFCLGLFWLLFEGVFAFLLRGKIFRGSLWAYIWLSLLAFL